MGCAERVAHFVYMKVVVVVVVVMAHGWVEASIDVSLVDFDE